MEEIIIESFPQTEWIGENQNKYFVSQYLILRDKKNRIDYLVGYREVSQILSTKNLDEDVPDLDEEEFPLFELDEVITKCEWGGEDAPSWMYYNGAVRDSITGEPFPDNRKVSEKEIKSIILNF